MENIHKKIKLLRKENNLSQEDLAKLSGYSSRSTIAKIESGKINIPLSKIKIFANIFDVNIDYLLGIENYSSSAELLHLYNNLNEKGRQKVTDYLELLNLNDEFLKEKTL